MNIDRNTLQKVRIKWTRDLEEDPHCAAPDVNDEGFWPSMDPQAAGYIGDDPTIITPEGQEARLTEHIQRAEERMAAWTHGDWTYVGVIAKAEILIPIGGSSFRILNVASAGLWGVESDAGEEYLQSVYEDEKADLLGQLATLGAGLADAIQTEG